MSVTAANADVHNDGPFCVRLYCSNGKHAASLCACGIKEDGTPCCYDLCLPSGRVLACNIELELVDIFASVFGWSKIREGERT